MKEADIKYRFNRGKVRSTLCVPDGCLCIVSMFLKYYSTIGKREVILNSKKYNPAGICATLLIPGKYEEKDKQIWVEMNKLEFAV